MGGIAKTRLGVLYRVKNKKRSEAMKGSKGSTCDSVIVNFTKEGFPATACDSVFTTTYCGRKTA